MQPAPKLVQTGTFCPYNPNPWKRDWCQDKVREMLKVAVTETWGADQWPAMDYVMTHESNYYLIAQNPHSDACGLGQFIPCNRYGVGNDLHKYRSAERQIADVIRYIKERPNYRTPYNAYVFKLANGWY